VPFLHAASRLQRRWLLVLFFIYAPLGAVEGILLRLVTGETDPRAMIAGYLIMLLVISGVVVQAFLIRELHQADLQTARGAAVPVMSPVDVALAARSRRVEARRVAQTDPLLARDLRIGRPDLPRSYDDGGLVDLNTAPAPLIAQFCGLPGVMAEGIVTARQQRGGFPTVDDALGQAHIPVPYRDVVRDRGVVIRLL